VLAPIPAPRVFKKHATKSNLKRKQHQPLKTLISIVLLEAEAIIEQWQSTVQKEVEAGNAKDKKI
jgi:hypothetical protein